MTIYFLGHNTGEKMIQMTATEVINKKEDRRLIKGVLFFA
jgi:hypothetical protein